MTLAAKTTFASKAICREMVPSTNSKQRHLLHRVCMSVTCCLTNHSQIWSLRKTTSHWLRGLQLQGWIEATCFCPGWVSSQCILICLCYWQKWRELFVGWGVTCLLAPSGLFEGRSTDNYQENDVATTRFQDMHAPV